ncbi:hypothetical protein L3Q82_016306 [Scortum barcoo]|uniref:Uncharacterized protein n=1 Tax=Scortum barcoo TaxID=214431 RepID=A0ACB8VR22_9TELE|nr:hypothetical protein L3Q82_016306 [Scortum barcoo]
MSLSTGLGTPRDPPGRAGGSVWGEGGLGISAQTAASSDPVPDQADENGWMDGKLSDDDEVTLFFLRVGEIRVSAVAETNAVETFAVFLSLI